MTDKICTYQKNEIEKNIVYKVIFLDRDGTINEDPIGYISSPKEFVLYPFTAEAIRNFNIMGFKTIIVSNQSGIGRGKFTEDDLKKVHEYMNEELKKENAHIDLILYSPYHINGIVEPYNIDHETRKPGSGMFYDALKKTPIKASESYMIGDKPADIEFGKRNGLITFLVKTGDGLNTWENIEKLNFKPDFVVENILSASNVIKILEKQKNG